MFHSLQIALCSAMTIDGRLSTDDRRKMRLGSNRDIKFLRSLRNHFHASYMGGETFRNWPIPAFRDNTTPYYQFVITQKGIKEILNAEDFSISRWKDNQLIVIYSKKDIFEQELNICTKIGIKAILLENQTPVQILQYIEDIYPCRKILLEGGGRFCHPFFLENIIQDIYLTLIPKVLGGTQSQGLCVGEGFLKMQEYILEQADVFGNEVVLHYRNKDMNY